MSLFIRAVRPASSIVARRTFTTSRVACKSVVDSVTDALKAVDRTVSDAAVKGIDKGEEAANSIKSSDIAAKTSELYGQAKGKASEIIGDAGGAAKSHQGAVSGKASELYGEAKGKASELAGKAESVAKSGEGSVSGKASEIKGEVKGKANELSGQAKGKAEEMKGKM